MTVSARTDAELVARAAAGDKQAFGELISRYQDAVFGFAYSHTGSFADAEDIAQEAFLAAWSALGRLRDGSRFGPWLHGITLNKARMHLRATGRERRRQQEHAEQQAASRADGPREASELPAVDAVTRELDRLTPAWRVTATLYYINGYSYKQVSSFLGVPLGTVKRRLYEARQKLKEKLAMIEKKLKARRPKPSFSRRVLERIESVKVAVRGEDLNAVLLTDKKGRSFLMYTGRSEAESINRGLQEVAFPRPMTHDLFVNTVKELGGKIVELVVSALKENTFYGTLVIRLGQGRYEIDCRPSDGLAIALRADAPIYVHKSVAQQVVMKRKDGKPLSPRGAQRQLKKVAEESKKRRQEIDKLRAEVVKKPNSAESQVELAHCLDRWEPEAAELFERAARCARNKKLGARARLGLADCWSYRGQLRKARRELNTARRLWPKYQRLREFQSAAFIYASRLLRDWHGTGNERSLQEGLRWLELYLKNREGDEKLNLFYLPKDALEKLQQLERYQQLLAKYGIEDVSEGLPVGLGTRITRVMRVVDR